MKDTNFITGLNNAERPIRSFLLLIVILVIALQDIK